LAATELAVNAAAARSRSRARRRRALRVAVAYTVLVLGAALMVPPFVWMLSTSLKLPTQVSAYPPEWIPNPITLDSYREVWNYIPFGRIFLNTAFVSFVVMGLELLTSALAGYAFARIRFPGRERIFLLYLGTLMVPGQVVIIPRFLIIRQFEWIDTYQALIVPAAFSAFGTFWLRQHFLTIPIELEDAARIDGASRWTVWWRIMVPLSGPVLATLGIFAFLNEWNSFLWPLIVINSMDMRTLSVALRFFQGAQGIEWNLIMAAATMTLMPVLVVYAFAQRYFVRGVALTGLGGR
jgi:multiple sugar transport system permease protein